MQSKLSSSREGMPIIFKQVSLTQHLRSRAGMPIISKHVSLTQPDSQHLPLGGTSTTRDREHVPSRGAWPVSPVHARPTRYDGVLCTLSHVEPSFGRD